VCDSCTVVVRICFRCDGEAEVGEPDGIAKFSGKFLFVARCVNATCCVDQFGSLEPACEHIDSDNLIITFLFKLTARNTFVPSVGGMEDQRWLIVLKPLDRAIIFSIEVSRKNRKATLERSIKAEHWSSYYDVERVHCQRQVEDDRMVERGCKIVHHFWACDTVYRRFECSRM